MSVLELFGSEHIADRPRTAATDVFGLAALVWKWTTGEGLYEAESLYQLAVAAMMGKRRPYAGPPHLGALLESALDPDPAKRAPLAALLAALRAELKP
jgi:hypothetical protein